MSSLALMEVQRALFVKLSGDGILMGVIQGIYDNVPQNTLLPYVVIGDGEQTLLAADDITVTQCALTLNVWTEVGGRKTALMVLNRLQALLHLGTLTLSGLQLVMLRVDDASTVLSEQGTQLRGRITVIITVAEEV